MRFIYAVGIGQLGALFLQGGDKCLSLLNELLFVFEFPLQALNQHHLLSDRLFLRELCLVQGLVTLSQFFQFVRSHLVLIFLPLELLCKVLHFSFEVSFLIEHLLIRIAQGIEFGLDLRQLRVVPLPCVLELSIESGLHLGLLEEHLLSDFVDLLLVLDLHGVTHASDFFSRLCKVTLHLLSFPLTFVEAGIQLHRDLVKLFCALRGFLQLGRQVFLQELVICLPEGQGQVRQGLELVRLHDLELCVCSTSLRIEHCDELIIHATHHRSGIVESLVLCVILTEV